MLNNHKVFFYPLLFVFVLYTSSAFSVAHADWMDRFKDIKQEIKQNVKNKSSGYQDTSKHSVKNIVRGLKEALKIGAQKSVDKLGRKDGFLSDQNVKIPTPKKLRKTEKLLIRIGQKKLIRQLVVTMNRAAEQSVKATFPIFVDAIKQMTFSDAKKIYNGRNDEATRYFRKTAGAQLHLIIKPIVQQKTQSTGVTKRYKKIKEKARKLSSSLVRDMPDIDEYVTMKAIDGLFKKIAEQETAIRSNPKARTTKLLRDVFGN